MRRSVVFAFCFVFFVCVTSTFVELTEEEVNAILERIPRKERRDFIKNHLIRGYNLVEHLQTRSIKAKDDDNLAIGFYLFYKTNNYFQPEEDLNSENFRNVVCFPGIGCIDIDDPSFHPK